MKPIRNAPCFACGARPLYDLRRVLCRSCYGKMAHVDSLPPNDLQTVMERWREVDEHGCWNWLGSISPEGYGRYSDDYMHRISYESAVGPIPDGLQIDHLCRNRRCYNPEHLEAVTPQTNFRRSDAVGAVAVRRGSCNAGHPFDEANTYHRPDGKGRKCRRCSADRQARYYAICADKQAKERGKRIEEAS